MESRDPKLPLQGWPAILIICGVILAGQAASTWYLSQHQVTAADVVLELRETRGGRSLQEEVAAETEAGGRARKRKKSSSRGPKSDGQASTAAAGTGAQGAGDGWSLDSSGAVERWDKLMQQRIERLAEAKGLDPASVLPQATLREEALASGDMRSEASQRLMAEYSRILRELPDDDAE
jgi:predicted transposase YdaD